MLRFTSKKIAYCPINPANTRIIERHNTETRNRSSCPEVFLKKGVHKNLDLRPTTLLKSNSSANSFLQILQKSSRHLFCRTSANSSFHRKRVGNLYKINKRDTKSILCLHLT